MDFFVTLQYKVILCCVIAFFASKFQEKLSRNLSFLVKNGKPTTKDNEYNNEKEDNRRNEAIIEIY